MKFASTHETTRRNHCLPENQSPAKPEALSHHLVSGLQSQIGQALGALKLGLKSIGDSPTNSAPLAMYLAKSLSLVEQAAGQVENLMSHFHAAEPGWSRPIRTSFPPPRPRFAPETADLSRLTPREYEVLAHLGKGCVDKEIAHALGISLWTVHAHVKNIFSRLGVRTRTEAAIRYLHSERLDAAA